MYIYIYRDLETEGLFARVLGKGSLLLFEPGGVDSFGHAENATPRWLPEFTFFPHSPTGFRADSQGEPTLPIQTNGDYQRPSGTYKELSSATRPYQGAWLFWAGSLRSWDRVFKASTKQF